MGTPISEFVDDDGMLNEFALMYDFKDQFPLHYIVFKQLAAHLPHEANSEQTFSIAGNLSDPNIRPHYLALLTRVRINKDIFEPTVEAIKARYYKKYSKAGKVPEEAADEEYVCVPPDAPAPAPAPTPAPAPAPSPPRRSPRRSPTRPAAPVAVSGS